MAAKRKRHDEELLAQCVARVLAGESATSVSKQAKVPYSTLMGRVYWKKTGYEPASRRRQSVTTTETDTANTRQSVAMLPDVDEQRVLQQMARMQRADICVRRRDVLRIANGMLETEVEQCGTLWFLRFRERYPGVSGHGTNLLMSNELVESLLTSTAEREAVENAPSQQSVDESEDDETLTAPQRAVQLLQAEYAARLDPEDMVDAFDIMADTITAKVLLVIKAGSLRDMWLRQRIRKVRESEQGA